MSIESVSYITPTLADFLKIGKSPEIEGLFSGQFLSFTEFSRWTLNLLADRYKDFACLSKLPDTILKLNKNFDLICCDVVFPVNQRSDDGVHVGTLFKTHSTLELIYKDYPNYLRNIFFWLLIGHNPSPRSYAINTFGFEI